MAQVTEWADTRHRRIYRTRVFFWEGVGAIHCIVFRQVEKQTIQINWHCRVIRSDNDKPVTVLVLEIVTVDYASQPNVTVMLLVTVYVPIANDMSRLAKPADSSLPREFKNLPQVRYNRLNLIKFIAFQAINISRCVTISIRETRNNFVTFGLLGSLICHEMASPV